MKLFLFIFVLSTLSLSALASDPVTVAVDNGNLSAISHSKEFKIQLEDGRDMNFTRNGKSLFVQGKAYSCKVTHFSANWGASETGFECGGRLRKDNVYIRILAEPKGESLEGLVLQGPDQTTVQIELNWMKSGFNYKADPSVAKLKFKLVSHMGWVIP